MRQHPFNANYGSSFWLLAVLTLLCLTVRGFCNFPSFLVIDGTAYPGVQMTGTNSAYFEYVTGSGVLVLTNAQGGDANWGATESEALNTPSPTGDWDGALTISLTGHSVLVPQVVVTYPEVVTPVAMQGYDGVNQNPIGSGTNAVGNSIVAYNGFTSGYIFTFGTNLPCYRYQAAASCLVINVGDAVAPAIGWPPSNIYSFPSQLYINGQSMTATSFTEGINNGYSSTET